MKLMTRPIQPAVGGLQNHVSLTGTMCINYNLGQMWFPDVSAYRNFYSILITSTLKTQGGSNWPTLILFVPSCDDPPLSVNVTHFKIIA
jgi:hypothetical protein